MTCYARVATLFVSKSVARVAPAIAKKRLTSKRNFRFSGSRKILRLEGGSIIFSTLKVLNLLRKEKEEKEEEEEKMFAWVKFRS